MIQDFVLHGDDYDDINVKHNADFIILKILTTYVFLVS